MQLDTVWCTQHNTFPRIAKTVSKVLVPLATTSVKAFSQHSTTSKLRPRNVYSIEWLSQTKHPATA